MAIEWLINDETPEHWGVTLGTLTRNNQAVDVLSLPINRAADAVIPFDYDQVITLKRDGEPYFRGRVMSRVVSGESAGDGMTIEVGGPWWELSRMPYVVLTLSVEETPEKTYRLRSNMSGGVRQTSLQMIQQVLDYAVGKGLGFQLQEEPYVLSSFKPPRTTKQDRRCDELIRSALTAHPDTVVWFDYSTEPPTFRLTTRGDEGTTISFTKGVPPLRAVNLQPRPDLVPSGVVVRYERSGTAVSTDGKRPAVLVDAYPPESEPDVLDAIAMTITLKKGEHALAGYAQRLYTAFSVMPWEGGVQLWAADGVTGLHPGQSLNITSDQASWATMGAMVQTVQESLDNGFVNVSLGLPQYCGYKPTIWTITRRQHEDQRVDTIDSGETEEYAPEFEETVLNGPDCVCSRRERGHGDLPDPGVARMGERLAPGHRGGRDTAHAGHHGAGLYTATLHCPGQGWHGDGVAGAGDHPDHDGDDLHGCRGGRGGGVPPYNTDDLRPVPHRLRLHA
ncbi:hypothetical protein [Verrucomicrobium spinosum]|uniref:hypothetical protein n=1 Tax=Verrucomicrobium spinosum TaxID=2736 RepID=UPI000A58585D|nr:hypothetical protein [Verrucomicrobium spinosum]